MTKEIFSVFSILSPLVKVKLINAFISGIRNYQVSSEDYYSNILSQAR